MKLNVLIFTIVITLNCILAKGDDFFNIGQTTYFKHCNPSILEAKISTKGSIAASSVIERLYCYDQNQKLIKEIDALSSDTQGLYFSADEQHSIYFVLPNEVLSQDDWSAVVVFGDSKSIDAQSFPRIGEENDFSFPESSLLDRAGPLIERKTSMPPLIEHEVQTYNPRQPQLSLFMCPPPGMTDASQAKGVLCLSLLNGSLQDIKRQLKGTESSAEVTGLLKFAEDHQLIIICWGSVGLWDPHKSWDDLSLDDARNTDKSFDQIANAWAKGIEFFVNQYGIPKDGYLLWGISGSAQYACRLALRKPDYFLGVHVHIPSSFDKPTSEGSKILWCLTTGERESGYKRSLRFYSQCCNLGYPIIYKAIMHLGHADSPIADDIGLKFFDYALSLRDERLTYDANLINPLAQFQLSQANGDQKHPWPESFQKPAYVGDAVNQEIVPYEEKDTVPEVFRVSLPTKEIADAWNR